MPPKAKNDYHESLEFMTLPKAKDKSTQFYAVQLKGQAGTWPVFMREGEFAKVSDMENPRETLPFTIVSTLAELTRAENRRPVLELNEFKRPKTFKTRYWQNAFRAYKDRRYFEDPYMASANGKLFIENIFLYCPVREAGPLGSSEDHGEYSGIGEKPIPGRGGKPGECPKCNRDPHLSHEYRKMALDQLRRMYQASNLVPPAPLAKALAGV